MGGPSTSSRRGVWSQLGTLMGLPLFVVGCPRCRDARARTVLPEPQVHAFLLISALGDLQRSAIAIAAGGQADPADAAAAAARWSNYGTATCAWSLLAYFPARYVAARTRVLVAFYTGLIMICVPLTAGYPEAFLGIYAAATAEGAAFWVAWASGLHTGGRPGEIPS